MIVYFSPDDSVDRDDSAGACVGSFAVVAKQAACTAFVGKDLSRVAVTTAREIMCADAPAQDALAGRTFVVDVHVKGVAEPRALA